MKNMKKRLPSHKACPFANDVVDGVISMHAPHDNCYFPIVFPPVYASMVQLCHPGDAHSSIDAWFV